MPSSRRSRRRPYGQEHVELDLDRATGGRTSLSGPDGEWVVQRVRGSEREYRCPGCDQVIVPGTAHVVAWRQDDLLGAGVDGRRHWHAMLGGPRPAQARPVTPARGGLRPRVVASDIDGTLLRTDGTLSPVTASALARAEAAGLHVVLVTARPPRWLESLRRHVAGHGTVVCANGAAVLDLSSGALLDVTGLDAAAVGGIAAVVRERLAGAALAAETPAGFVHERGYASMHPVPAGTPVADRLEDLVGACTLKVLVRLPEGRGPADLAAAVGDLGVVADSGAVGLGEIGPPGVTKAVALARWAGRLGAGPDEVWAVGDAPNDLPMLLWAGIGFAVANAHPAVLAAADRVCPANDDDGVAAVLDEAVGLRAPASADGA